jgi:hypothetical protein
MKDPKSFDVRKVTGTTRILKDREKGKKVKDVVQPSDLESNIRHIISNMNKRRQHSWRKNAKEKRYKMRYRIQ